MPQLLTPFPYLLSLVAFSSLRKAIVSYRVSFFRKGSRVTWDEGQTPIKTKNVLVVQPCKGSNLPLFTNQFWQSTHVAAICPAQNFQKMPKIFNFQVSNFPRNWVFTLNGTHLDRFTWFGNLLNQEQKTKPLFRLTEKNDLCHWRYYFVFTWCKLAEKCD